MNDVHLSRASTSRQRKSSRKQQANEIRSNFVATFGQVNFDAKQMKALDGHRKSEVNRLAVVLKQLNEDKLLCSAKCKDGTGKCEAEQVHLTLVEWGIAQNIIASGFDTTYSNTGELKVAVTLLKKVLNKQLLWMACRHHVLERVLEAAYTSFFGKSAGPEPLLNKLSDMWDTLDVNDISPPSIPAPYCHEVDDMLKFIDNRLNHAELHIGDYKEYLELAKLYLGGTVERKKRQYTLKRPEGDHHARWMSKAIYIIKILLLLHQLLNINHNIKKTIPKMALFVVFVYLKPWFNSRLIPSAASNDLNLYKALAVFSGVDKKASEACCKKFSLHSWYLSEENIAFSIFDEGLPTSTRSELAEAIFQHSVYREPLKIMKPKLPVFDETSQLLQFVGPRSRLLFDILELPIDFLAEGKWYLTSYYKAANDALKTLSATNDSAERAL